MKYGTIPPPSKLSQAAQTRKTTPYVTCKAYYELAEPGAVHSGLSKSGTGHESAIALATSNVSFAHKGGYSGVVFHRLWGSYVQS
jgi:hypothetical protein